MTTPLVVRARLPGDLPGLLPLLQRTHEQDGYPVRSAAVSVDWLAPPDELAAAVALDGGQLVGHVGLHAAAPAEEPTAVQQWQRATGQPPEGLAVVSRLFTDRAARGAGTRLLEHAVQRAVELDRVPVLLVDPDSPARAFYLRRGWREVGTAVQHWGHRTVDAVLMVQDAAPDRDVPAGADR